MTLSKELIKAINFPSNKEWRERTAYALMAIGMPEKGIILAITGGLDNLKVCKNYCLNNNIDYAKVRELLD